MDEELNIVCTDARTEDELLRMRNSMVVDHGVPISTATELIEDIYNLITADFT